MLYTSKITRQGQITIPKHIREKYGLNEGDKVTYVDLGDRVEIVFNPKDPLSELRNLQIDESAPTPEVKKIASKTAEREATQNRDQ